jgi:hypothetical protein
VLEGAAGQLCEAVFGLRAVQLWFHWKLVGAMVLAVVFGLMGLNAYVYTTLKADIEAMRREAQLSHVLDTYLTDTLSPTLSAHSSRNSTRSIPTCAFCPLTRAADARTRRR